MPRSRSLFWRRKCDSITINNNPVPSLVDGGRFWLESPRNSSLNGCLDASFFLFECTWNGSCEKVCFFFLDSYLVWHRKIWYFQKIHNFWCVTWPNLIYVEGDTVPNANVSCVLYRVKRHNFKHISGFPPSRSSVPVSRLFAEINDDNVLIWVEFIIFTTRS